MEKEKSCGALVYRHNNGKLQILVLKHRMGGHWSFPKGHVEQGETEQETALREVKEETDLTIRLDGGFRRQITYSPRPGVVKDVVYFLGYAAKSRTKAQQEEVSEIRWVDLDKCEAYITYENDRQLLAWAKQRLVKL